MNGVSLSTGSTIASPGFITALPIISSPQNKGLQFSEHIPDIARTIQVKAPTMGRRERKLRNYKRLIRRARRNRASEPCRMYAGVGSFLRIHTNGTVDGEFSKNPGELSIVQFIGLATAVGLVRIKGEVSKNYLCMNKNGILYGHPNMTDECIFKEHQETNHYNYYSSHKYSKKSDRRKGRRKKKGTPKFWFVALNKNGTSRPAHRSRMDQMFTRFLLNRCKKIVVSEPDGPFDITKFTWSPTGGTFQGKIGEEKYTEREEEEEKDTGEEKKGKGKGKKRRCKGKKKGKKCRNGKKEKDTDKKEGDNKEKEGKEGKEEKKDKKDRNNDKSKNENETICKRRWRNRKNRNDYVDETTAMKRRQRCKNRLRKQRLNDRQAKKEAKSQVDTPVAPAIVTTASVAEVNVVTTTSTTTTASTTTTTSVAESLPSATEQTESDLKLQSNRFSATNGAATDFRSVFENLIKVIQINNKEMLSNFSSVKGGLHASLLRSGRQSGQQGGSESIVSGASLGVERKRRHHHGDDGRRHERALSDSREGAETLSNSDLNMDTQSSETGFKTDLVSDSMNTASTPSVTSRTSPVRRAKSSQFELLLKVLNELESQNGRTRPDGSKDDSDSDNFRTGVLIVGNGPRTPSWRQRLRRRHRNKSDSDTDAEHLDI